MSVEQIIKCIVDEHQMKTIYYVYGEEEISQVILSKLLDAVGDEVVFVPESLIKGDKKYPLYNIKNAKYLVITGVIRCDVFDTGFMKSLVGGDSFFCPVSGRIITTKSPKIIIFFDKKPLDYKENDNGFLFRLKCVENGKLINKCLECKERSISKRCGRDNCQHGYCDSCYKKIHSMSGCEKCKVLWCCWVHMTCTC